MKTLLLFAFLFTSGIANAQNITTVGVKDPNKKTQLVEASCGECNFKMDGKSCDLAVRIDGKTYFVDGAEINQFGDAHAKDGFCEAVRKAEVQGEVENNRFRVSYFKLLKSDNKKDAKKKN
ncbi:MAG: hypothetical protein JST23_06900 [Bacteroidetes bacterium]|nr:hypothetical protein [Bacteroidota bacterium]